MKIRRIVIGAVALVALIGAAYQGSYGAYAYAGFEGHCNLERPINIIIRNWSAKRIVRERFLVQMWKNGHSANVLADHGNWFDYDKIVEPFTTTALCVPDSYLKPPGPTDLDLAGQIAQVNWFNKRIEGGELRLDYKLITEWP
ncbi:hypothetical protein [Rhizobium leguminosarum]